jgi:toxin ParE1/3/4
MKAVVRRKSYYDDLAAIEAEIAKDNPTAAVDLWLSIDDQVAKLADENFPRRPGRVKGTGELVVHPNYIVILEEDASTITVLNVVHARRQWPPKSRQLNVR